MGFFDKLFGKNKPLRHEGLMGREPKAIPDSEIVDCRCRYGRNKNRGICQTTTRNGRDDN